MNWPPRLFSAQRGNLDMRNQAPFCHTTRHQQSLFKSIDSNGSSYVDMNNMKLPVRKGHKSTLTIPKPQSAKATKDRIQHTNRSAIKI